MSDYAARRDAGIDKTLNAIDAVIPVGCMTCGQSIPRHSVLHLFCSKVCHTTALAYPAERRDDDITDEVRAAVELVSENIHADVAHYGIPTLITEPMAISEDQHGHPMLAPPIDTSRPYGFIHNGPPAWLSMTNATMRSIDAASEEIARRHTAQLRHLDESVHAEHRRETRGGAALWVLVAAIVATAGTLTTTDSWPVAVLAAFAVAWLAWFAWVSVGNGRAAAFSCPICHPPCEPGQTTG